MEPNLDAAPATATIADRICWARTAAGLSKRSLSELAQLDPSHVRALESGSRPDPRASTVRALAGVLGVSLDWLLEGEGAAPTPDAVRAAVERARAALTLAEEHATGTEG